MYSTVLIVGAGESGLCMGIQLKKQFGIDDYVIYERLSEVGGTWYNNTYPGAACDIPAVFYSYSFATNPKWTTFYPQGPELLAYFKQVAKDYNLRKHITFNTEVETATWNDDRKIWSVKLRRVPPAEWETLLADRTPEAVKSGNVKSYGSIGETWTHECKVLISAVGGLVVPNDLKIKGDETFGGKIFHSSRWDHTVDLTNKDVVLVGNGCTASQILPAIEPKVKSLTQIVRTKHWMFPRPQFGNIEGKVYDKYSSTVFRWVPGTLTLTRWVTFLAMESAWLGFRDDARGAKWREASQKRSIKHIKSKAPEKYWDLLIPDFTLGLKRRIFDDDYPVALNSEKVLLTRDEVTHLGPNKVYTSSGAEYAADVIVMANGFQTNDWIHPLEIIGRGGEKLSDHWEKMGGPSAYNTTANHGFPNFFIIIGPNSLTGHSSVIHASEHMINYSLKIAAPVLKGEASEVEVKREAEVGYKDWIQSTLKKTVFKKSNFHSWYVRDDGWNSSIYPASQLHFAYHAMFPKYKDWKITKTPKGIRKTRLRRVFLFLFLFGLSAMGLILKKSGLQFNDLVQVASNTLQQGVQKVVGLVKA